MRTHGVLTRLGGSASATSAWQRALRLLLVAMLLAPPAAFPATIPVDGTDSTVADDGVCSLREAINNANDDAATHIDCVAGSGPDTLELGADVTLTEVDNADRGLPVVATDITIEGGGFTVARDDSAPDFGIFQISAPDGALTLNSTTIANGALPAGYGAGIWNYGGTLNVAGSSFTSNSAFVAAGIRVDAGGTATISDSSFTDNEAFAVGGLLVFGAGSSAALSGSTLSGNVTAGNAPAIAVVLEGEVTVDDSTMSDNSGGYAGGGLFVFAAEASVTNSTISGNSAAYGGGAYAAGYGSMTLKNNTIVGNTETSGYTDGGVHANPIPAYGLGYADLANNIVASNTGGDCGGLINDLGNNFSSDLSCPGSSMIVADVDFDSTLADNGGPTQTHALLAGSVAIEAALNCGLSRDQRGEPRCFACDSGSYELLEDEVAGCDCVQLDGPGEVTVNEVFDLDLSCANPGTSLLVAAGRNAQGSVRHVPGCGPFQFGVGPRANNFGSEKADGDGNATSSQKLGDAFGNETIYYQVVDRSKCEPSPVLEVEVNKADPD